MFALGGGDLLEFHGEDLGLERVNESGVGRGRKFSECEIAMGVSCWWEKNNIMARRVVDHRPGED